LAPVLFPLSFPTRRSSDLPEGLTDLGAIAAEVAGRGAVGVVVGLPRSLSGEEGLAARRARDYAGALQRRLEVPVRLVDERLTTRSEEHTSELQSRENLVCR